MASVLRRLFSVFAVLSLLLVGSSAGATGLKPIKPNPIVFVHGSQGSGAQFESQAMRFTSNGYPASYIAVLEYDSPTIGTTLPAVLAQLDALIADVLARTGATQVDLMGHSLGTTVSHAFLATPERAAKVANYVNLDGRPAAAPPGGVPTLALWAGAVVRPVPPLIVGATNVTIPDQEHTEVATSAEAFFEMFHFLRGRAPLTTRIIPQLLPEVSGRVTNFPQNTGLDGATLDVWWVDGRNGQRVGHRPYKTFQIGPDGSFGPFRVVTGLNFEFAISQPGQIALHYFLEPFVRSDALVRLNVAAGLAPFLPASDSQVSLTIVRFKEFWGDRGAANDVLAIDGTDVINPTTAPSGSVGGAAVSFFLFDAGNDGVTNLTTIPFPFGPLPFLTGADLFMPTQPPGTIRIETVPRGDASAKRRIHVRNIPSSAGRVAVQLNDFEQ